MVLLTRPEVRVLADQDGQGKQAADHVNCRATGVLLVHMNALWADQCSHHFLAVDGNLPQEPQLLLVYHLFRSFSHLFERSGQPSQEAGGHVLETGAGWA